MDKRPSYLRLVKDGEMSPEGVERTLRKDWSTRGDPKELVLLGISLGILLGVVGVSLVALLVILG